MRNCILSMCVLLIFTACDSRYGTIEGLMSQMKETPVNLCQDSMVCLIHDSIVGDFNKHNKMTMVVYSDTSDCSMCYINHLDQWNELLPLEKKYKGLRFVFIIEARSNEQKSLLNNLTGCNLNHTIYVDNSYSFRRNNSNIPEDAAFHTFLLDENNKVILVGNPLHNEKIEKLFYKIIDEKLGTKRHRQNQNAK